MACNILLIDDTGDLDGCWYFFCPKSNNNNIIKVVTGVKLHATCGHRPGHEHVSQLIIIMFAAFLLTHLQCILFLNSVFAGNN